MQLGISLPLDYLAGAMESSEAQLFKGAFGQPDSCLFMFKEWRISSVEVRQVGPGASARQVVMAAERVWDAGLAVTVHSHLPREVDPRGLAATYPELAGLLEKLANGQSILLTVHPHTGPDPARAMDHTRETLCHLLRLLDGLPVSLSLELLRGTGLPGPWASYRGLSQLTAGISHSQFGLCWDFGHAQAAVDHGLLPLEPPREFVKAVNHTHVHGLGPDGRTHWPLVGGGYLPLDQYIRPLVAKAYQGVWNLELSPSRFAGEEDLCQLVSDSVRLMEEAVRKCEERLN